MGADQGWGTVGIVASHAAQEVAYVHVTGSMGGPFADNLGGTLSGLVGTGLTLQPYSTPGSQFNGLAANGTGTTSGNSNVTNITVTCTTNPPRFVYVTNGGSNNISAHSVDATSGALAPIAGSPFAAGNLPVAIYVN